MKLCLRTSSSLHLSLSWALARIRWSCCGPPAPARPPTPAPEVDATAAADEEVAVVPLRGRGKPPFSDRRTCQKQQTSHQRRPSSS